jgi:hypothetical protein
MSVAANSLYHPFFGEVTSVIEIAPVVGIPNTRGDCKQTIYLIQI